MLRTISLFCLALFMALEASSQVSTPDTTSSVNYKKRVISYGQSDFKYSLGISLFAIHQLPDILKQTDAKFTNAPLSGFLIKANDNQIGYRLSGFYLSKQISFSNECADCEITSGRVSNYALAVGFEKDAAYGSVQPYFGLDLGFVRNRFSGESQSAGTSSSFTNPYSVITYKNGGSLTPFVGIKFNVVPRITLAGESSLLLMYSYESQNRVYHDLARTRTHQNFNKWEYLVNPLNTLSIQFNLVRAN